MNEPRSYAKLHVEGYVGKFVAVYIGGVYICTLVFTRATKSLVLNIERTSQN